MRMVSRYPPPFRSKQQQGVVVVAVAAPDAAAEVQQYVNADSRILFDRGTGRPRVSVLVPTL